MPLSDFITKRKSKTEVAKDMNISVQFLHRYYIDIAAKTTNFSKDYPVINGESLTHLGLTDFQQWILRKLREFVKSGMRREQFLKADNDGFLVFNEELDSYLCKENFYSETPEVQEVQLLA